LFKNGVINELQGHLKQKMNPIFAPNNFRMATFLFDKTIFGPVKSRRLGVSLGINLLPNDSKFCSFNCIYCECGWNPDLKILKPILPTREYVYTSLEEKLTQMVAQNEQPDVITFAGNGEPTLHPEFPGIIDDTILLRDRLTPMAKIAVLSNSTMIFKPEIVEALKKVDDNILKLDSGIPETVTILNKPVGYFSFEKMIENLISFNEKLIIQTLFIRGSHGGVSFDNTTEHELDAWIRILKKIKPQKVMIYTIARDTPIETISKIEASELYSIAKRVGNELNLEVDVSS
jgi:wyosine [tRNA(Phe)-imidazoG37] synthetase (radical SAM superfamily)